MHIFDLSVVMSVGNVIIAIKQELPCTLLIYIIALGSLRMRISREGYRIRKMLLLLSIEISICSFSLIYTQPVHSEEHGQLRISHKW